MALWSATFNILTRDNLGERYSKLAPVWLALALALGSLHHSCTFKKIPYYSGFQPAHWYSITNSLQSKCTKHYGSDSLPILAILLGFSRSNRPLILRCYHCPTRSQSYLFKGWTAISSPGHRNSVTRGADHKAKCNQITTTV
jgi:hypothetical protein